MCGGTVSGLTNGETYGGLSPRVRGNPRILLVAGGGRRSIPACAGEPRPSGPSRGRTGVYPRVCGGTLGDVIRHLRTKGLSPRVRGNRGCSRVSPRYGRSIPACAGEPGFRGLYVYPGWVYPRVCGGTLMLMLRDSPEKGLSPRVRGNHGRRTERDGVERSIPACAGEP